MNSSLNNNHYRAETFQKSCTVTGGKVHFKHGMDEYHITADCFEKLEGKTVLIDAAFAIVRGGVQIGRAIRVSV